LNLIGVLQLGGDYHANFTASGSVFGYKQGEFNQPITHPSWLRRLPGANILVRGNTGTDMTTLSEKRLARPGRYDRSGQLMVELWPERPAIEVVCPECGAPMVNGRTCREIYEELLDLETQDPDGAGSVHALSVLCYVLQHPRGYSDAALSWGVASLKEILEDGQLKETSHHKPGGLFRIFRRKPKLVGSGRPAIPSRWQITIEQVYRPDPHGHPERVQRWACAILGDLGH
jgi:hypothetical protein